MIHSRLRTDPATANDLFSRFEPTGPLGRFFDFPIVRIVVVAVFLMPVTLVNALVVFQVIEKLQEPLATQIDIVRMVLTFLLLIAGYRLYCAVVERRPAVEMALDRFAREAAVGALVGAAAVTLLVAVLFSSGAYVIEGFNPASVLPKSLILFGVGALLQDILFLCVVFRLSEELAGTGIAMITSLALFGAAHAGNPDATAYSVGQLVVSSIVILAPFILTRRLWVSWGFHASWNFMQAAVFGMANSGVDFPKWIVPEVSGPTWLTGGSIGLEGSVPAIALDVLLGFGVLLLAIRRGQWVSPRWKRRSQSENS